MALERIRFVEAKAWGIVYEEHHHLSRKTSKFVLNFIWYKFSSILARLTRKLLTTLSGMRTKPREAAHVISSGLRKSTKRKKKTYEQYKLKGTGKSRKVLRVGGIKPMGKCLVCGELGYRRKTYPKVKGEHSKELYVVRAIVPLLYIQLRGFWIQVQVLKFVL
ncbi:hypothetical protein OROGR_012976 [Orobanche gracilis]